MAELQRDSSVPLYQQLEDALRQRIRAGEWQPGERIASENELNREYGLSRMTARGVLTKLVNDGVLFRVPGKGTFVSPTKISTISPAYRGVREQLESMGYETRTELIRVAQEAPTRRVRERLNLAESDAVYAVHRLRLASGEPISLHRSYIPAALAPGLEEQDLVNEQLCVILEGQYGLRMKRVIESLEVAAAQAEEAKRLGVPRGAALLQLEDVISAQNGTTFEFTRIVFRGDKIRLDFEYKL